MSVFNVPLDLIRCVLFPMLTYRDLGNLSGVCSEWRSYIVTKHARQLCDSLGASETCKESQMSPLELLDLWNSGQSSLACGDSHAAMVTRNGHVLLWRENTCRTRIPLALSPREPTAIGISCGHHHTMILLSNGTVLAFGRNDRGQLGLTDKNDRDEPCMIQSKERFEAVKAGENFTLFLTRRNTLAWTGLLNIASNGIVNEVAIPTEIPFPQRKQGERIVSISAGARHILVLTNLGRLLSAGDADVQLLGRSISSEQKASELNPVQFAWRPENASIVQIAAGLSHSLVLFGDGSVFTFGTSSSGELGLPRFSDASTAQPIPNLPKAIAVSAGSHHSLILTVTKNKIVAFGMGALGQLGYRASFWSSTYPRDSLLPKDERKRIKYLAAGNGFSACLSGDGEDLFACGRTSLCAGAGNGSKSGNVIASFSRVPEMEL